MFKGQHREKVRFAVRERIQGMCWITYPNGVEDVLDCVVDTGAASTVIPQKFWSKYVTDEELLALPTTSKRLRGISGSIECKELEVPLTISGTNFQGAFELGKCKVCLAFDNGEERPMKQVLLGVGGGALDKGGLCINWKEGHAYFIEVDDVPKAN